MSTAFVFPFLTLLTVICQPKCLLARVIKENQVIDNARLFGVWSRLWNPKPVVQVISPYSAAGTPTWDGTTSQLARPLASSDFNAQIINPNQQITTDPFILSALENLTASQNAPALNYEVISPFGSGATQLIRPIQLQPNTASSPLRTAWQSLFQALTNPQPITIEGLPIAVGRVKS